MPIYRMNDKGAVVTMKAPRSRARYVDDDGFVYDDVLVMPEPELGSTALEPPVETITEADVHPSQWED